MIPAKGIPAKNIPTNKVAPVEPVAPVVEPVAEVVEEAPAAKKITKKKLFGKE